MKSRVPVTPSTVVQYTQTHAAHHQGLGESTAHFSDQGEPFLFHDDNECDFDNPSR